MPPVLIFIYLLEEIPAALLAYTSGEVCLVILLVAYFRCVDYGLSPLYRAICFLMNLEDAGALAAVDFLLRLFLIVGRTKPRADV